MYCISPINYRFLGAAIPLTTYRKIQEFRGVLFLADIRYTHDLYFFRHHVIGSVCKEIVGVSLKAAADDGSS